MKSIALFLLSAIPMLGATITLGTNEFADGAAVSTGNFTLNPNVDPLPFNVFSGSDVTGPSASFSWTFSFVPGGTIGSANILMSLYDLDSAATGNQIASFLLNGTVDLTASLQGLSEAASSATGRITYLTLDLSSNAAALAQLQTGTATFALTFAAPGGGILGDTPFNGGGIDFSTLTYGASTAPEIPEPSTMLLMGGGLAILGWKRFRR